MISEVLGDHEKYRTALEDDYDHLIEANDLVQTSLLNAEDIVNNVDNNLRELNKEIQNLGGDFATVHNQHLH